MAELSKQVTEMKVEDCIPLDSVCKQEVRQDSEKTAISWPPLLGWTVMARKCGSCHEAGLGGGAGKDHCRQAWPLGRGEQRGRLKK